MLNFLKKLFNKTDNRVNKTLSLRNIEYDISCADLSRVEVYNGKLSTISENKKTILFVDDYEEMRTYFKNLILEIKDRYKIDLEDQYNIIFIVGDNCAKDCILFSNQYPIHYSILDITLREILKRNENGQIKYGPIDGIDLAREIEERDPCCKFLFLTAHNIEDKYGKFHNLHNKYTHTFNKDLLDSYLNKLDPNKCKQILNLFGVNHEH